jgi:hypothetical protein
MWVHEKKFMAYLIKFNGEFEWQEELNGKFFLNKSLKKFIKKLEVKDRVGFCTTIKNYPIFMNGSGNPDFERFVNGQKKSQ